MSVIIGIRDNIDARVVESFGQILIGMLPIFL